MQGEFDEPTLDDLEALEDDDLLDDDLDELLSGIEDDDYEPEPWESLDDLADEEYREFDYYADGGAGWDEID